MSVEPAADAADLHPRTGVKDEGLDWSDRVKAWVERTCAAQGVPVKATDPVVLAKVADILNEAREARRDGAHRDQQAR